MFQESRPVLLLALVMIIAVGCSVDSSPAAPSPAAPSPAGSSPAGGINWATSTILGRQVYVSPSGRDTNDGSSAHPRRRPSRANAAAKPGPAIHAVPGT